MQDGLITFEDFKVNLMKMEDDEPEEVDFDYEEADSYLIQDPRRPNTLTADALSLLN